MKSAALAVGLGFLTWSAASSPMAASVTTEIDGVRVELSSEPEPPVKDRQTTYTVRVVDSAGKPVTDARVTLTGRMADGMSIAAPLRPSGEPGMYRGHVLFTMEGRWDLTIRVVSHAGRLELPVREQVAR